MKIHVDEWGRLDQRRNGDNHICDMLRKEHVNGSTRLRLTGRMA